MPWYDSREEEITALKNYLDGNYGELTALEVQEFRQCLEDPNGTRFDADHAGIFSEEVDPLDFRGLVFIFDLGRTFEEGYQILLDIVGPHPITPLTIWRLHRQLNNLATESTENTECFRTGTKHQTL